MWLLEARAGAKLEWTVCGESPEISQAVSAAALGYVGQPCMLLKEERLEGGFHATNLPILLTLLPMTVSLEHSALVCNCFPLVWDDS